MKPPEMELRQKVHRFILKKDKSYRAFESIHMDERGGLVTVHWIDREGNTRKDQVMYGHLK